jgi:hypothetical protein
MKHSNLAERLEQFEAEERATLAMPHGAPRMFSVVAAEEPRRVPRRLTLTQRRIQISETGLRHFRVF